MDFSASVAPEATTLLPTDSEPSARQGLPAQLLDSFFPPSQSSSDSCSNHPSQ